MKPDINLHIPTAERSPSPEELISETYGILAVYLANFAAGDHSKQDSYVDAAEAMISLTFSKLATILAQEAQKAPDGGISLIRATVERLIADMNRALEIARQDKAERESVLEPQRKVGRFSITRAFGKKAVPADLTQLPAVGQVMGKPAPMIQQMQEAVWDSQFMNGLVANEGLRPTTEAFKTAILDLIKLGPWFQFQDILGAIEHRPTVAPSRPIEADAPAAQN